ncbi:MAG: hypothetical protein ACRBC3_12895 [Burkholderiaceae bacterium]
MSAESTKPAAQNAEPATRHPSNLRTALVLGLIAAVFFGGVVVNRMLFG